jgi:hypothetical protein
MLHCVEENRPTDEIRIMHIEKYQEYTIVISHMLSLHESTRKVCLTLSAGTMKKVSMLYLSSISLRVLPLPGMYRYLLPRRFSVSLVT